MIAQNVHVLWHYEEITLFFHDPWHMFKLWVGLLFDSEWPSTELHKV